MEKNQSMILQVLKREKNVSQLTDETYQTKYIQPQQKQLKLSQTNTQIQPQNTLCTICCTMQKLDHIVSVGNCGHVFCIECTRSHLEQKMVSYMKLRCCQQGCWQQLVINSKKMDLNQIRYYYHSISTKQQKKIKHYLKWLKSLKKKSIKKCERCLKAGKTQKCHQCQSQQIQIPQNFKKCPSCRKIIEKIKGCDHVKCLCEYEFCFLCYQQWNRSHVCQFKIPIRTGISYLFCFCFKIIIYMMLAVVLGFFVTGFCLFVCIVSSVLLGFFVEITILQKLIRNKQIPQSLKLAILILSFIMLPVTIILSLTPGFFIPILNICYKQKIFLDPTLITQFALNIFSCIVVVRLI